MVDLCGAPRTLEAHLLVEYRRHEATRVTVELAQHPIVIREFERSLDDAVGGEMQQRRARIGHEERRVRRNEKLRVSAPRNE